MHDDRNYDCPATALGDTIPGLCICKTPEETKEITMNEREKNFPRVTPDDIEFAIAHAKQVYYGVIPNTTTTICAVTLSNGFTVIGTSGCISKENFDQKMGETTALDNVRDQLWMLLGFRLKQALYEGEDKVAYPRDEELAS